MAQMSTEGGDGSHLARPSRASAEPGRQMLA